MKRIYLMSLLFFFAACGSDAPWMNLESSTAPATPCEVYGDRVRAEVIIGDLNWSDYFDLKNTREKANAKAIGQIRIPTINAACTAFLISHNTIMTNNHCVPNSQYAYNLRLYMRDEDNTRQVFNCDKLLVTNPTLDFAVLECDGHPGDVYGTIALTMNRPSQNQSLYVVQENCDYIDEPRCVVQKFLARGQIRQFSQNSLSHDADTLGGSSGSPIFDQQTHHLLGIHHAGMEKNTKNPAMNFGIPIYRIVDFLLENYPDIEFDQSHVDQDLTDRCL